MYKLLKQGVLRKLDNACIPFADGNSDYEAYKAWVASGNTPDPEDTVDPNIAIQAQIDALEAATYLNRGSRELQLRLMEREAVDLAEANNVTAAQVLAVQPYYVKLKALDDQIRALRGQLK